MSSLSLSSPLVAIPLFVSLAFLIVGSPVVYKFTDSKIGEPLKWDFANSTGAPTRTGLIIHAIVLGLLVYAFLRAYSPEAAYY
jgi:hypothetical protein